MHFYPDLAHLQPEMILLPHPLRNRWNRQRIGEFFE
jgi:hypothetical protein